LPLHCRGVAASRPGARQLLTAFGISRWTIEIQCFEQRAARIPDLVLIAMFDEQQCPHSERIAVPFDLRHTRSCNHEQPLIGTPVPIVGTPFGIARLNHHLGSLATPVSQRNSKSFSKPEYFALHVLLRARLPGGLRRVHSSWQVASHVLVLLQCG
jgi:hypothetical protein